MDEGNSSDDCFDGGGNPPPPVQVPIYIHPKKSPKKKSQFIVTFSLQSEVQVIFSTLRGLNSSDFL